MNVTLLKVVGDGGHAKSNGNRLACYKRWLATAGMWQEMLETWVTRLRHETHYMGILEIITTKGIKENLPFAETHKVYSQRDAG